MKDKQIKMSMKIRSLKTIGVSLLKLLLILILIASAATWRGQIFGIKTDGTSTHIPKVEINIDHCLNFFENASRINKITNQNYQVFDAKNNLVGHATWHKGEQGYGGRIPLFVFIDPDNAIKGVMLGKHYETSEYLKDVLEGEFLLQWNGIRGDSTLTHEVDVISGATLTSKAIISGIKSAATGSEISPVYNFWSLKNVLSFVLLSSITLAYFKPKWLLRYRSILQILVIGVFGFWLNHLITLNQIMAWTSGGFNWHAQLFILVVFLMAIGLPILFGKAFYCSWICPYGAAQELCGKISPNKISIPQSVIKILNYSREALFFIIMIILWLGFILDLSMVEPFAAFSITKAGTFTLALAGIFLVVSLIVPKAWCNYFCPTGYLLEWIRK